MNPDTKSGSSIPNGKRDENKKINPELISIETHRGARPGESYARVKRVSQFIKAGPGYFVAKPEKEIPKSRAERGYRGLKRIFIGRPLFTAEEGTQRLNKVRANRRFCCHCNKKRRANALLFFM